MTELLSAVAIAFILEGIMPFISPRSWREMVIKIISLPDKQVRTFGLFVMLSGVILLWIVR